MPPRTSRRVRAAPRRRRKTLARHLKHALRRRVHRTAAKLRARHARHKTRRTNRRLEIQRTRAAAPLAARSITGTPRPAANAKATTAARPGAPGTGTAAPMTQRVKRGKGGRFNGSTGAAKKTTGNKTGASTSAAKNAALTPEAKNAAAFQRALAAAGNRVARIDQRTEAADRRIDRMFPDT